MSTEPSLLSSAPLPPPATEAPPAATQAAAAPVLERSVGVLCAVCQAETAPVDTTQVNGHPVCPGCVQRLHGELASESAPPRWIAATIAGLVGAMAGAAVWAGIGIATDFEIGYVAVLVGFLAGLGVRIGAGSARGQSLQILAVVLAVVGLGLAKYGMFAGAVLNELDISPFDPRVAGAFFDNVGSMLSPFDALWLFLAVGAAWKVPAPSSVDG
jgi:hypothetical protein